MQIVVYVGKMSDVAVRSTDEEALLQAVRLAEERIQALAVTWLDQWEAGKEALAASDCLVVVGSHVTPADLPELPETGNGESPRFPLVVVTSDVCNAAVTLCKVPVEAIVDGDPDAVAQAIRRAAENSIFLRAIRVLERHPRFSGRLRAWLTRTLQAVPPFSTVTDSIRGTPWQPSTIRSDWAKEIGRSSPKEWISMIQFARAIRLKRGTTWAQTAHKLGVSRRTLERRAKHVMGRGLTRLTNGSGKFEEAFESYLGRIITGSRG